MRDRADRDRSSASISAATKAFYLLSEIEMCFCNERSERERRKGKISEQNDYSN